MKLSNLKYLFHKSNRKQLITVSTTVANVAIGIFNIVLSMVELSLFLGFYGAFNIVLAVGKFYALERLLRLKTVDVITKNTVEAKSISKINNCTLICSFLFFSFGIVITFFYEDPASYDFWMIMYISTTAFFKVLSFIFIAVVNLRKKSGVQFYIKLMSAASALISLAVTQRAIIYYMGDTVNPSVISGVGSIIFGFLAMLVGLFMVLKAQRERRNLLAQGLIETEEKPVKTNDNEPNTFIKACKKICKMPVLFFKNIAAFIHSKFCG